MRVVSRRLFSVDTIHRNRGLLYSTLLLQTYCTTLLHYTTLPGGHLVPEKFILDATASTRQMWKGRDMTDVLFIDKLAAVRPDIIADARFLPFRENIFTKIFCDPPHLIRASKKNRQKRRFAEYGLWERREDWIIFLAHIDEEFARCLKDNGEVWFKTISGGYPATRRWNKIDTEDLAYLRTFRQIEDTVYPSKHKFTLSGGRNLCETHETLFVKIPEEAV